MPKSLERDLGLYATITISIGAMVGSGIFVLPGLAAGKAGPAAIFGYLLAGFIVLPAALSKAEMATAIPESGGTYLYIDRAMGPLPGTIAGIGAWFSLVFKSAFALVGLGAYLLLFVPVSEGSLVFVSLGLGLLLVVVNVLGAKLTGGLQAAVVSLVLLVLLLFVGDGMISVDSSQYHPFFTHGVDGLFAATGLVFVSYAGVTKIASVAEEVENPGRNIPIAILTSIVVMMAVYTLTVYVIIGVSPTDALTAKDMLTPMALAAGGTLGRVGVIGISVVAVLALTSMANAGILSSSRYPLAMSRDDLAPESVGSVSERFKTPVASILFTGTILLVLVAFVPVLELAKLASAFQILVFAFINVALIAFRESSLDWYDPEFTAPGYPFVQIGGFLASLLLLTQMGAIPLVGAFGLVVLGAVWYRVYGRERTKREGAAVDAVRRSTDSRSLEQTERTLTSESKRNILVAMGEDTSTERERTLLTIAAYVAASTDARVYAVRFEEVPEQLTLSSATSMDEDDREFEAATEQLAEELPARIEPREIVSHNTGRAVVNFATDIDASLLLGEWRSEGLRAELLDRDVDWYMNRAPCDVTFVRDRGFGSIDEITVLTQRGPYGPTKVRLANAFAEQAGASLRFVTAVGPDPTQEQIDTTEEFHEELADLCTVPVELDIVRSEDRLSGVIDAAVGSDFAVVGAVAHSKLHDIFLGDPAVTISSGLDCSVLLVHPQDSRGQSFLNALIKRVAY
ncbi:MULTISPECIES: amino acid permease [Halorussus]|uniref:amino acid permease n=1 Tax=Halorussus TaxID=1070314 RepID=UPI00209F0B69|nr:amino acid permease [Halorussus vallis]USZ76017.1 amino acid permease [Halorussus vallis]